MIIFELGCGNGHRFEGWFSSADDFARQSEHALVRCPVCEDSEIAIVPSARVRVNKNNEVRVSSAREAAPVVSAENTTEPSAPAELPMQLPMGLVQKLRETIRNTENVGRRFPEEARKIHYDEVPPRAIRGQASPEEAQSLRDEGIEFASLPAFLTSEQH